MRQVTFDGSFIEKIWGSNLTGKGPVGSVLEMDFRGQWCGGLSKPTKATQNRIWGERWVQL